MSDGDALVGRRGPASAVLALEDLGQERQEALAFLTRVLGGPQHEG